MENSELIIEGRNAIIEAFRAGRSVDKLFIQEHTKEGSMNTLLREAKKTNTLIQSFLWNILNQCICFFSLTKQCVHRTFFSVLLDK